MFKYLEIKYDIRTIPRNHEQHYRTKQQKFIKPRKVDAETGILVFWKTQKTEGLVGQRSFDQDYLAAR